MQALLTIDVQGDYFTECTACRESCEYVGNWLSMDITNEYERMPDIVCIGKIVVLSYEMPWREVL